MSESQAQADSHSTVDFVPEDGPWAIKSISGRERKIALEAAKRAKMTVGEWLAEAIRAHVESERDENAAYEVMPPSQSVATIDQPGAAAQPALSVTDIGQAIDIAVRISSMRDRPIPTRLLARAMKALVVRLNAQS